MASDIETKTALPVYQPGEDWETLIDSADEIIGYDLARDETADDLVGVPFMVVGATFRPGLLRGKERQAYVSCEVRVAPHLDLRLINARREGSRLAQLETLERLAFGPDSHVVFNDGSTGVYRQVVKYLAAKGYVTLPDPVVEAGPYGESSLDLAPYRWAGIAAGTAAGAEDGWLDYSAAIRLYCPRGLRLSLYENDYTQTGKTRYLG